MFMLLWESYQGGRTSMKLSDWFIFSSKHHVSRYLGEEFHSYTIFDRRIWLFYNITFIPETSIVSSSKMIYEKILVNLNLHSQLEMVDDLNSLIYFETLFLRQLTCEEIPAHNKMEMVITEVHIPYANFWHHISSPYWWLLVCNYDIVEWISTWNWKHEQY